MLIKNQMHNKSGHFWQFAHILLGDFSAALFSEHIRTYSCISVMPQKGNGHHPKYLSSGLRQLSAMSYTVFTLQYKAFCSRIHTMLHGKQRLCGPHGNQCYLTKFQHVNIRDHNSPASFYFHF